jgi:hypothetical protein
VKPVSITAFGRTQTVAEWAQEYGIRKSTLVSRLKLVDREGDVDALVSAPVGSRGRTDERNARWRPDGSGPMWEGVNTLRYDEDLKAQAMVLHHGPFETIEVAAFMGVTHQRISQIEQRALAKAQTAARRMGLEWRDIHAYLTAQRGKGRTEPAW